MKQTTVKFKVLRDYNNDVCGYQLGDYILFKKYYSGNQYSWYVSKSNDFWDAYNDPKKEAVWSCKKGKELLVKLANQ